MGTSLPPVGVRFQAEGVQQTTAAFQQVASAGQRAGQQMTRTFTTAQGQVSSFGRASVASLNATGFALSQLAATGKVGFRELTTSVAGFAAFFGPTGLIVAGVAAAGAALADFWQRQRDDVESTADFIKRGLSEAEARRRRDDPLGVAAAELRRAQAAVAERRAEFNQFLRAETTLRAGGASESTIAELRAKASRRVLDALTNEMEQYTQLTDAVAKNVDATLKEMREKKKSGDSAADIERKRRAAIADTISALQTLRGLDRQTGTQITELVRLYRLLSAELRTVGTDYARLAAIESQLATIRATGVQPVAVRAPLRTVGRETAAGQLTINPTAARRLAAPIVDQFHTQGVTTGFGEAFATALQTGLASGAGSFIGSGAIQSVFNTVGSALVAGLATLNPWLAALGGFIQSALGGLFGGRASRPLLPSMPLPIDIRRVINDPNAGRPVQHSMRPGPSWGRPLVVTSQEGQRILSTAGARGRRRGLL